MNTGHRTDFTDTELSAWLDGEGDASQRERVEAWLREQPEAAARVRLWAADRDVLRARFDAVRDEPVPERLLDVLRASARRGRRVQAAIAASLLLTGGLVGSMATWQWQAQRTSTLVAGAQAGTPAGWVQRAAYAHSVFTPEPRHPVEVRAQEEHLARWLTRRIDIPVKLFDLRSEGFELMGGRLLPDANGKSAQLMYENPLTKERVTVYLRKPDADAPTTFRYSQQGTLGMFYWVEPGIGCALVGALPKERLLALAHAVYQQHDAAGAASASAASNAPAATPATPAPTPPAATPAPAPLRDAAPSGPVPPRRAAAWTRAAVVVLLGFASGLPLALTGQAMQAWLSMEGLDVATIGFLSLVGLPYTFKFLWAPLMDRFDLPWLGRRRGWLVLTQLLLAAALFTLAGLSPKGATQAFALMAVAVAFISASQDVVIDAYRTDMLPPAERGIGASLNIAGYRAAMILSGGIALIWTDAQQGGGWTWPEVYRFMAGLMVAAAVLSATLLPRLPAPPPAPPGAARPGAARHDLLGFLAVVAAVAVGYVVTDRLVAPGVRAAMAPLWQGSSLPPALQGRWADLVSLLAGIAITLPLAAWAARRARFETLLSGLSSYFSQRGAAAFLVLIVLYKLGDAFAGSLLTPFLLKAMAYTPAEVGVVNKVLGLWLTIAGALAGGALMLKLGLWRSLMLFGVLQMASNLAFWWLAAGAKGSLGAVTIPAFDWVVVQLSAPTPVDGALLVAVTAENLSGGMGTAAFVAFLMSLTNQRFTATQYALLSAFASVGRVWVGPLAGVLAESIGWPAFFIVSTIAAAPALALLWWLRASVRALDAAPEEPSR